MRLLLPLLSLLALWLSSCGHSTDVATAPTAPASFLTTSDGKKLSIRHWNLQRKPKTVLIALHGIEGAVKDFHNLGKSLSEKSSRTTLYALNLRGSGYDPSFKSRGNIKSASLWKRDLRELHQTLHQRHPEARFIWIGESMGSLISLHTVVDSSSQPDGLILVSPVVSLDSIPRWQVNSLKLAAALAPGARVSLEALAGGSFQATTSSDHFEQVQTNPYHVEKYTLRYLATLAKLSESMNELATQIRTPTLILHGGKDTLTSNSQIKDFAHHYPKQPETKIFGDSHHLLFHDKQKSEVVSTITNWVNHL